MVEVVACHAECSCLQLVGAAVTVLFQTIVGVVELGMELFDRIDLFIIVYYRSCCCSRSDGGSCVFAHSWNFCDNDLLGRLLGVIGDRHGRLGGDDTGRRR